MRLAAAIAVLAVSLSAALYVHQRHVSRTTTYTVTAPKPQPSGGGVFVPDLVPGSQPPGTYHSLETSHPSWEDPAALLVALGGLAVAVAVGPRFAKPS